MLPPDVPDYDCDPPNLRWPQMTAHTRAEVWGLNRAGVHLAACWSGYWDDDPAVNANAYDAAPFRADGTPNEFRLHDRRDVTPASRPSRPCPAPLTPRRTTGQQPRALGRPDGEPGHGIRMLRVDTAARGHRNPGSLPGGLVHDRDRSLRGNHARRDHRSHAAPAIGREPTTMSPHHGTSRPGTHHRRVLHDRPAGIGALVVDLGLSWMLRRQEQNAADPGAIAAAAIHRGG